MKRLNQQGVGMLAVVALLVVVAAIGGVGWFVYRSNQSTSKILDQSAAANSATSSKTSKSNVQSGTSTTVKSGASAEMINGVQKTSFSQLPQDLQEVIFGYTKVTAPMCIKAGQIVDFDGKPYDQSVVYTANAVSGAAITGIGCDGGSSVLFLKDKGQWMEFGRTQMAFDCDTLANFHVPAKLLAIQSDDKDYSPQCGPAGTQVNYQNKYED